MPLADFVIDPADPFSAVTHAAPYDYYRRLADGPPLRFDVRLDCWLATGAAGVHAVLEHPDCRVRPPGQPVPDTLEGTPCGAIFAELVRMNEGERHAVPKQVLARSLGQVDLARLQARTWRMASDRVPASAAQLNGALFELPLFAMADLLGFAPAQWPALAAWTRDFVACLSPLSNGEQLAGAQVAADALLQGFTALLREADALPGSLLAKVVSEAEALGWQASGGVLANLVGLLSQTCDATAGLLGNAIVALRTQPQWSTQVGAAPRLWPALLREVSRHDPSIHNTRRYTAQDVEFDGVRVAAGQMIVVVLASAGHAECGFGHGRHACPGQSIAQAIATASLQAWADGLDRVPLAWRYLPSLNARIPVFSLGEMK
ncbi:cytochrome P450 [Janthinobacterium sp. EB271-G4-7A]|uniref:cytochrome P450 n=1 Tax=Janthinobacterium sp. EB271-G4-7A TaxID=2775056 RepID=UPI001E60DEA4|nr:cytochrome P450 [Janthinobacterium sp. EB271-G4-7A]MCC7700267.1 cytochrome P450 [Janthinobacterium sp. EB271-G4-7A]